MITRFSRFVWIAVLLLGGMAATPAKAQAAKEYAYQMVTTIESVVPASFGRSKVSYTPAYKGIREAPLENLFSLTGLNMGNLQKNEEAIVAITQQMANDGYELVQALPLTSSIQGNGIFMTRYLFRKMK